MEKQRLLSESGFRGAVLRILARAILVTLITVALQLTNPVWAYFQPDHFGWQTVGSLRTIAFSLIANFLFATCLLLIAYAAFYGIASAILKSASMDKRFFLADLMVMALTIFLLAIPLLFPSGLDASADSHGALIRDGEVTAYGAAVYLRNFIEAIILAAIFLSVTAFATFTGRAKRLFNAEPAGSSPDS